MDMDMGADVEAAGGHRSARARGLAAVREQARAAPAPLTDPPLISLETARTLSGADCREPGHTCRSGQGCAEFRRVVEDARSALHQYRDASDRYTAVLSMVDPEDGGALDRESDGGLLLRALLAPEEWRRSARAERVALEPYLREFLPSEPAPEAPPPVHAAHGLLVDRLGAALRGIDAQVRGLTRKRDELERFAHLARWAERLPPAAEALGLAIGLIVLRYSYGDDLFFVLLFSIVSWLLSAWILRMVLTRVAARLRAAAPPNPYPTIDRPLERAKRAARDAARLDERISDLLAVYTRLR